MKFRLEELKEFLRVDFEEDDELISGLVAVANQHIKTITGKSFKDNPVARHYCKILIAELYENRTTTQSQQVKPNKYIENMLYTLQFEEEV